MELTEVTAEDRIQEEKDRIVRILEAGFSERQRLAVAEVERGLAAAHAAELEELKERDREEMCGRLEELRQKMIATAQVNLARVVEKKEKEFQELMQRREKELTEEFEQQRRLLEEERGRELEEAADKIRKKSKMELENLRSRFKFMQTTANLDRSPSVSESELSFEVRRPSHVLSAGAISTEHSSSKLRAFGTNAQRVDSYFLHLTMHTYPNPSM